MARTRLFTWLARAAGSARTGREPTRRDLLVGGLSAAAVGPAVGCGRRDRIAIVGGGLAGVHVAYRLAQAGVEATLYEASARLGGRTFTARGQFPDDQIAELGGEFIDSDHATLHALAEELGLALDDRLGGPYASLDPEVVWSSGAPVDPSALLAQFRAVLPALLDDLDAAESDEVAFAALDEESLADWLARRVPPAVYPELHTVLSVAYRGEFGREPSEQSALNLIYLVGLDDDAFQVFGESDERFHVHLGSDALVAQMAAGLPAGAVAYGHRLVRATGDGPFELTFAVADGERTARVDRVVFALPFTMLRRVDLDGLALSPLKREIVASLGIGMNTKVMAGF